MSPLTLRILFLVIYLIIDITYVTMSSSFYQNVVTKIQHKPMQKLRANTFAYAILSYAILGLAWFVFVPATMGYLQQTLRVSVVVSAALSGFLLGLAIYGVFNFTNAVMFEKYDLPVLLRDMAWGVSWLTFLSTAYGYASTKI